MTPHLLFWGVFWSNILTFISGILGPTSKSTEAFASVCVCLGVPTASTRSKYLKIVGRKRFQKICEEGRGRKEEG